MPAPDMLNPANGTMKWSKLGPIAPGDIEMVSVSRQAICDCFPPENCVAAFSHNVTDHAVEDHACLSVYLAGPGHTI